MFLQARVIKAPQEVEMQIRSITATATLVNSRRVLVDSVAMVVDAIFGHSLHSFCLWSSSVCSAACKPGALLAFGKLQPALLDSATSSDEREMRYRQTAPALHTGGTSGIPGIGNRSYGG